MRGHRFHKEHSRLLCMSLLDREVRIFYSVTCLHFKCLTLIRALFSIILQSGNIFKYNTYYFIKRPFHEQNLFSDLTPDFGFFSENFVKPLK